MLKQRLVQYLSAVASPTGIVVQGKLNTTPNTIYTVELFCNGSCRPDGTGQGQTYLGSVTLTTNASGQGSFTASINVAVLVGQFITATVTDPGEDTSSFSLCKVVTMG